MGTLKTETAEFEVPDGSPLIDGAEELGVMFGCRAGGCMTCKIEIIEGAENLNELTENEKVMDMQGNERLACMCKLKQGEVKIGFDY